MGLKEEITFIEYEQLPIPIICFNKHIKINYLNSEAKHILKKINTSEAVMIIMKINLLYQYGLI